MSSTNSVTVQPNVKFSQHTRGMDDPVLNFVTMPLLSRISNYSTIIFMLISHQAFLFLPKNDAHNPT